MFSANIISFLLISSFGAQNAAPETAEILTIGFTESRISPYFERQPVKTQKK